MASNPNLVAIICDEIKGSGPIPFARFMELALYHPEYGYYSSGKEKIGPGGDYYTSPTVHPLFAKLLARQLVQMAEALGTAHHEIAFIEFGAGSGLLAAGILRFVEEQAPALLQKLRYIIIEESPSFRARQRERLLPRYPCVCWESKVPDACIGVVFSNELLDAFPVHRLHIENDVVSEIVVDWEQDCFVERLLTPSSTLLDYLRRVGLPMDQKYDCEVNLRALDWMHQVGQALCRGFVLTIDYGYPAELLYHPTRKKGTFFCYHQHTVNEHPYQDIGEQDMTSHVDFTSLAEAGEQAGLALLGFTDQTHFLMGLGIAQEMQIEADKMETSSEAKKNFLAMKQLMAPATMGKTFKVLIQGKGVPASVTLDGLTFRAFPKEALIP
jgi:SAM-dependent MidA family methyltransferase